jgi:plastocyanin
MRFGRLVPAGVLLLTSALLWLALPAGAGAKSKVLKAVSYPDTTTYSCRTDAITIHPGQNLNLFSRTKTCPNARVVSGPGGADVFSPGSSAQGYVTRFKPSMVEIKGGGRLETPSVWDLHLHHVVWLSPDGGPTFASGEEKTVVSLPQGYGLRAGGNDTWGLNYMIHNLTAAGGRQVYVTWEIDWVPESSPSASAIRPAKVQWLDVAGRPQIYPVFDAERGFDTNGDGKYVFPDEVPDDPAAPGFEERRKISPGHEWTVPDGGATLVSGVGHLHPGGLNVRLQVARDGRDAGTVDGDRRSEVRKLFRSDAKYYEPAGAVSWDVSMKGTRRGWRIALKGGDTVSIDTTYDVERASWYESMGILPVAVAGAGDPKARDPFDDRKAVKKMYEKGGILTHRRLPENIDRPARDKLGLPDPRDLRSSATGASSGVRIDGFLGSPGGYSAIPGFSSARMRPPVVEPGDSVTFTNLDALPAMPQTDQAWHTVTSCKPPCNRGAGIGYPLANGPLKFDSGQLGFGTLASSEVTTGSNAYTTPPLTKPGKTYTYFCRIHPFMRGSIRVAGG